MKKIILGILVIGLMLTTGCGKKSNKNNQPNNPNTNEPTVTGPTANTDESITKEQVVDGLKITNIGLVMDEGGSTFTADVVNEKETADNVLSINIIIKDEEGNTMTTLLGYIGKPMEPHGIETITAGVDIDLTKAKSVEYVRNY